MRTLYRPAHWARATKTGLRCNCGAVAEWESDLPTGERSLRCTACMPDDAVTLNLQEERACSACEELVDDGVIRVASRGRYRYPLSGEGAALYVCHEHRDPVLG